MKLKSGTLVKFRRFGVIRPNQQVIKRNLFEEWFDGLQQNISFGRRNKHSNCVFTSSDLTNAWMNQPRLEPIIHVDIFELYRTLHNNDGSGSIIARII